MTRRAPAGTVFLARSDARGMNACPQSARVAKWQPQRTQNPPPSKGMKVRVLSRALAATIFRSRATTPEAQRSARAQDDAGERGSEHEREQHHRRAPAIRKTLLVGKPATGNPDGAVDAILADIDRRAGTARGQRGAGLRDVDPEEFPERDGFAKTEETHRRQAEGHRRRPQAPAGPSERPGLLMTLCKAGGGLLFPAAPAIVPSVHYQTHHEQEGRKPHLHQPSPTGPRWSSEPQGTEMRAERLKNSPPWTDRDARLFQRRPP